MTSSPVEVRPARAEEFAALGDLLASAYAALPGMPGEREQPQYYALLRDVARRARTPSFTVFAALDGDDLLGSVDFIEDVRRYGAGGTASTLSDTAGIRLLAVKPAARGRGVGKALTRVCIERAREAGRSRVILHTTRAMETAWGMYERLGFERFPAIDFQQGSLEVFGFQLPLAPR